MFESLDISDADLKLIINSVSNVVKSFTCLIKSNRIKLANNETLNINEWCFKIFNGLNQQTSFETNHSSDYAIKYLQVYSQFILYLLQNAIEFEAINQQQLNETNSTDTVTNGIEIMERLNSSTKKFENFYSFFSNLVEIIKNLIKNFHHLILNTSNDKIESKRIRLNRKETANSNILFLNRTNEYLIHTC